MCISDHIEVLSFKENMLHVEKWKVLTKVNFMEQYS